MIKHIVFFKITDAKNDEDLKQKALQMQQIFGSLKDKIDVIRFYEVGINARDTEFSYDVAVNSEFKSWEDLETYINHPEHQKAIALNKNIQKEKAVVDYEF